MGAGRAQLLNRRRPMRVLAISHYATWGGPINRASCLAPLLRERGIETMVLVPAEKGDAPERLNEAGVKTIQMPLHRMRRTIHPVEHARYFRAFPGEIRSLRKVLREHSVDLVQIYGLNLQGGIAGKLEGIPVVWQLVDVGNPFLLRRLTMPIVLRLADVLMTTGRAVAQAHPGATSFNDRLFVFFPPVDLNRFRSDAALRAAARLELGVRPGELVIGTVGNISPQKDHFTFVEAAAALKKRFAALRFVILGTTLATRREFAAHLLQRAQELGLSPERDITIRNPGTRVPQLAQAFDIFWLTSLWEGLPTAVEEAMALQIPVVATDVGSVREAIHDGVNGCLVPARDPDALVHATLPLLHSEQLRKRIGAEAYSFAAKHFDSRICAEVHALAFERAVANHNAAHHNGWTHP